MSKEHTYSSECGHDWKQKKIIRTCSLCGKKQRLKELFRDDYSLDKPIDLMRVMGHNPRPQWVDIPIDLNYYRIVVETQDNPNILKAELIDIINDIEKILDK